MNKFIVGTYNLKNTCRKKKGNETNFQFTASLL